MKSVVGELLQGGVQISTWLLVLPAKTATLPHISPTLTAAGLFCTPLETVVLRIAQLIDLEQITQIIEMALGTAPLSKSCLSRSL